MPTYADSSFLVSIYSIEPESQRALNWMARSDETLFFTPFHRHELRTAIRQKVFRSEATAQERSDAFRNIDSDLEEGILVHTQVPWLDAFRESDAIGALHGEALGLRSLDLLHVGIAMALKAKLFITFDLAQREIAQRAGMKVTF
jgi:predicted nucleic acid-binding protein